MPDQENEAAVITAEESTLNLEKLRIQLENQKTRYGLYKFVIGTVLLRLVTTIGNWTIQWRTLQSEIQAKQSDFIGQFVEKALDENLEKRRDFAQYFAVVSPTAESRDRWNEYLEYTKSIVKLAQTKVEEIRIIETEKAVEQTKRAVLGNAAQEVERRLVQLESSIKRAPEAELVELRISLEETKRELETTLREREKLQDSIKKLDEAGTERRIDLAQLQSELASGGRGTSTPQSVPKLQEALTATAPPDADVQTLKRIVEENVGSWIAGYTDRAVEHPNFSGFFIRVEGDDYFSRGTIVRGIEWDGSDLPRFQAVHGYVQGDPGSSWYNFMDEFMYLGPKWESVYAELSAALFEDGGRSVGEFTEWEGS